MVKKKTFYITTAIDYPNAEPHIGHAYQKIIADIIARYHRLQGKDVFFLTGTDEHGKKIKESAEKAGKSPKEFVDEMANKFKEAWKALNISYSRFIRTTDSDHEKLVQEVIKKCNDSGDIYKGFYKGYYCVGCEAYYTEKDLVEGNCPLHNRPLELVQEESYFFKLSKYQKFLLDLYKKNPEFILPDERRNEMTNRVKEGLKDLSISRTTFKWGIPFPLDKNHVIYVWFDALFNYLSGSGKKQEYWPADLHLLGKDNAWFHSVYWPSFLKSSGYKLPKTVFVHGFLTFNGQKISKSLGNAISPMSLVNKYGTDSIRYFISRNFVFGEDGDFSEEQLVQRHNNELANKLGNLVSRVSALAEVNGIQKCPSSLKSEITQKKVISHLEKLEFDKALNEIFSFIDKCNEYIQEKKPWEVRSPQGVDKERGSSSKSESNSRRILYELSNAIKDISILLSPFMPETSEKISQIFNFDISLKALRAPLKASKINKAPILFKKIETMAKKEIIKPQVKEVKELPPEKPVSNGTPKISYEDFSKMELKVGKIIKAEDHPNADKLLVLHVDFETEKRTIVAGIRKHYKKEELVGKKAIFVTNLAPAMLRGVESNGMILAAVNEDEDEVVILTPDKDIKQGSKIR